ncbi:hypothetical protein POTOM_025214 [Populus tomentosa]|uniref:Pentatricopeptide repeat-containing protein n=1 Tax=Populus tomentosa TaxID=118781 RepID=A0A8X8CNG0_POPTO|nr:hypothetical protein POTOM_025214 [Populus tomentosa]
MSRGKRFGKGYRKVVSYNIFLRGLSENRKVEEGSGAVSVWELMRRKGSGANSTTYGVLIHGLCKNGHLNKALTILKEAEDERDKLDALAHSSMVEALGMVHQMDNHGCKLSPHVCNLLINGFVRASKLEQEIHFFREMESKGCSPPLVVYNTLINGLCKAERFCHAYSFVKEMLKKDWKPDSITYSLLMVALNLWRQALDKGLEPYVTF